MDFNEIKRINEMMKMIKQLQDLRKMLEHVRDAQLQQEVIRKFFEEKKDQFWRGGKPSEQDLEAMREKTGYDKKVWEDIVRELLGEPPPSPSPKA